MNCRIVDGNHTVHSANLGDEHVQHTVGINRWMFNDISTWRRASAIFSAHSPSSVGTPLVAQSIGDALGGRAQAYDHGEALLQCLDGRRLALLDGAISDAALQNLTDIMDKKIS
jgi:hypothetical protein